MNKKEVKKAYRRYLEIVSLLRTNEDDKGLRLLDELIRYCKEYFNLILSEEESLKIIRYKEYEEDKIKKAESEWENRRRRTHDMVITQLKVFNRYLFKNYKDVPIGGICSLNPKELSPLNRRAVGDWVAYLIKGLYENGIITG